MRRFRAFLSDFLGISFFSSPGGFFRSLSLMAVLAFLASFSTFFDNIVRNNIDFSLSHQDSSSIYAYSLSESEKDRFIQQSVIREFVDEGASISIVPHSILGIIPSETFSTPSYQAFFADEADVFRSLYRTEIRNDDKEASGVWIGEGILNSWANSGYGNIAYGDLVYIVSNGTIVDKAPYGGSCKAERVPSVFSPVNGHGLSDDFVVLPSPLFESLKSDLPHVQYDLIVRCGKNITNEQGKALTAILSDFDVVIKDSLIENEYGKIGRSLLSFLHQTCFFLAAFSSVAAFLYFSAVFERKGSELFIRAINGMPRLEGLIIVLLSLLFTAVLGTIAAFAVQALIGLSLSAYVGVRFMSGIVFWEWGPFALFSLLFTLGSVLIAFGSTYKKHLL